MEIDSLEAALKDFDKKAKKEASPVLEQFLCHVAKTGKTMLQWSQFKNYFLFKLEKVMDDFRASAPEQRGPANSNVESIPFEDMKERILKIVNGYNGIPFTIQRLCELLTEPKRNYTGTEKFLRGVEKNVMVVSCVHPTLEEDIFHLTCFRKNGCSAVNRMNGLMLPGNTSFTERKVNGPGTPRPLNRSKVSLACSVTANGLPDSIDNKDVNTENGSNKSLSEVLTAGSYLGNKTKHLITEDNMEASPLEVKRLKFSEKEDAEEDVEEEGDTQRPSHDASLSKEAEAMVQADKEEEDEEVRHSRENEASSCAAVAEHEEPSSCAPSEICEGSGQDIEAAKREVPCDSQEDSSDMDQTEQQAPTHSDESTAIGRDTKESNTDSSSSCSIEESAEAVNEDETNVSSSCTTEPSESGAMESASSNTGTDEEPMEQD